MEAVDLKQEALDELKKQYDKLQKKYGAKELDSIYNGGCIYDPDIMFVFMNPTGRNIASVKTWKGRKSPWIGTKNIWKLFHQIHLIDDSLYDEIYLNNIFKDTKEPTISYLMIEKYNKHKSDKKLLKEYLNELDKKKFFSKDGVYQKYVKNPKNCNYDTLIKELKNI